MAGTTPGAMVVVVGPSWCVVVGVVVRLVRRRFWAIKCEPPAVARGRHESLCRPLSGAARGPRASASARRSGLRGALLCPGVGKARRRGKKCM